MQGYLTSLIRISIVSLILSNAVVLDDLYFFLQYRDKIPINNTTNRKYYNN